MGITRLGKGSDLVQETLTPREHLTSKPGH